MRRAKHAVAAVAALTVAAVLAAPSGASAAPRNDDFLDAIPVQVGSNVRGQVEGATKERGEHRHAESVARHSVWYRFRATRKVTVVFGTCRSNFDTVVAVYTGGEVTSLRTVDFNNDGCGGEEAAGSRVGFTARPGVTYHVAVVGFTPQGRFTLSVSRVNAPANDDFFYAAPIDVGSSVRGTTHNATRELHEPRHDGKKADLTVWYRLRVATTRTVELNTCGSNFDTVLAVYTGRRVDRLREVTSNDDDRMDRCGLDSRVTFRARANVTYRIALAEYDDHESGGFRLTAR
jgi:hypothetical protein